MPSRFTRRPDIRDLLSWLTALGTDALASRTEPPASRSFSLSKKGVHAGRAELDPNCRLSAHRRIEIERMFRDRGQAELSRLTAFFAHIPPLASRREIAFHLRELPYETRVEVTLDGISFEGRGDDPIGTLTSALHAFFRIHENIEMAPRLRPWALVPETSASWQPMLADTAEHALLRFAACDTELRLLLRQGKMHHCIPYGAATPERILAPLNRRLRETPPAPRDDWRIETWEAPSGAGA